MGEEDEPARSLWFIQVIIEFSSLSVPLYVPVWVVNEQRS